MMRRGMMRGMAGRMGGGMRGGMRGGMGGGSKTSPFIFVLMVLCGICLGCSSMGAVCKFGWFNKKNR
tara:strand:+ start:177 stop:377 length:201 start_codon:yes stop_codon:yes gene_type:complete